MVYWKTLLWEWGFLDMWTCPYCSKQLLAHGWHESAALSYNKFTHKREPIPKCFTCSDEGCDFNKAWKDG